VSIELDQRSDDADNRVAPFFEGDVPALAERIGASQVLNGSDDSHPEGLLWAAQFVEELEGLGEQEQRLILRENLAGRVA